MPEFYTLLEVTSGMFFKNLGFFKKIKESITGLKKFICNLMLILLIQLHKTSPVNLLGKKKYVVALIQKSTIYGSGQIQPLPVLLRPAS